MAHLKNYLMRRSGAAPFVAVRWMMVLLSFTFLGGLQNARADTSSDNSAAIARQVKAAYLYKFASYIEWPEGAFAAADSPLVIGVAGADPMAEELQRMVVGRTTNNRPITVRKLQRGDPLNGVHILFLGNLEKAQLAEFLSAAKTLPMLTVGESEEAYAQGSMINFMVAEDKMRFKVALKPVNQSGLKISARMLAVAYKVIPASS